MGDARSVSLIAIHTHDIPQDFPAAAPREANKAARHPARPTAPICATSPLSPSTATMHATSTTPSSPNPTATGFRLIVAIADVAHYVRPGSALDHAARTRGNSVYFPDRVVPMLPEALSNGWCSLRPAEDRGCLFVEIHDRRAGRKTAHRFGRGLMRSAARLTYEQVQRAQDSGDTRPRASVRRLPRAARRARRARGTLDLDLPERQVVLDADGQRRARRAPPAPRQPPADRGIHGAGQRRRRRGTGAPPPACDVPRARAAVRRKARLAARLPARLSASRCRPATSCIRAISIACCAASPARRMPPLVNEVVAAQPVAGGIQPRQYRPFRPRSAALCAFHQPDPPLRRPAGASRTDPRPESSATAACCAMTKPRASPTPPCTSPPPSGARHWPSAMRSTVTSLHSWRTKLARISQREFPV